MKTWMLTTVQTPKWSFDLSPTLEKTMSQHPPIVLMEIESEESSCSFQKDGSTESSRRESDI